jgi:hypothetical protein
MANRPIGPHHVVIKRMKARAAWPQTVSEALGHCAACEAKRHLWLRNDKKVTCQAMKRKRNELRNMLREELLLQEGEMKMQSQ